MFIRFVVPLTSNTIFNLELCPSSVSSTLIVLFIQIWLIQTKLELATFINSLISFEVAFRLVECGVVEPLIISFEVCHWAPLPVYRLAHLVTRTTSSMSEFMCITPSVVNFSANLGIVIFNMLTNTVRFELTSDLTPTYT